MKKALITGVTRGIGRACAELLDREGYEITGVARKRAPCPGELVCCDLAEIAGVNQVPRKPYDLIILNAARYEAGGLLDSRVYTQQFFPNVMANYFLGQRLFEDMRKRGSGHIIVIGSTGTDHFKEHMTAYVATKYALRGLFLGWERELEGSGVKLSLVAPGATLTSSWKNEQPPADILSPEEVAQFVWTVVREGKTGRLTL